MDLRLAAVRSVGLALPLITASLAAQCGDWTGLPSPGFPGVLSPSGALSQIARWDPDGPGPVPERLAVATHSSVWSFDPISLDWEKLPDPPGGARSLVGRPGGTLYVASRMPNGHDGIRFFDGTGWPFLDSGTNDIINVLRVHPNGELLVGGRFTTIGGSAIRHVAWRRGNQWTGFATSGTRLDFPRGGGVYEMTVDGAGDVVVAGTGMTVVRAGQSIASNVAGFQSNGWNDFPGTPFNTVRFAVQPNGTLVGAFVGFGQTQIARWQGQGPQWIAMGPVLQGGVQRLLVDSRQQLIAGGSFTAAPPGVPADYIVRWDGSAWQPLGNGPAVDGSVADLNRDPATGDLVVVGSFRQAGPHPALSVATFDGTDWGLLGRGVNDHINAVVSAGAPGEFFVGGEFTWVGATAAGHVARWTGSTYVPLGSGIDGDVHALLRLPNGDLVAGGEFQSAGGQPAASVARWDGQAWHTLGAGVGGRVNALARMPNGDLVAGVDVTLNGITIANILKWNGAVWTGLQPPVASTVRDLLVMDNGDLVACGNFTVVGSANREGVMRWNGQAWTALGLGMSTTRAARCLAVLPADGSLMVGTNDNVFRLVGASWSPMFSVSRFSPDVQALAALPDGNVVIGGGGVTPGGVSRGVARWNGTRYLENLAVSGPVPYVQARAFALSRDGGRLAIVGASGSGFADYLSFYDSLCPASVAARGAGCAGAHGANDFEASSLPWLGSVFRARASGLPAQSLTAVMTGFSTTRTPLQAILPPSLSSPAGCELLVAPDLFESGVPSLTGVLETALAIPDDSAVVGAMLHQQVLAFDLSNPAAAAEVTSTRALELTLGDF